MKPIKIITALFAIVFITSCSSGKVDKEIMQADKIVKKMIIDETSSEFYKKYFTPLYDKSKTENGETHIYYLEKIPELEFADTLDFIVKNGKISNAAEIQGVPDCFSDARNCEFKITKEKLLKILTDNKLLEPENTFIAKAIWDKEKKRFLWKATITKKVIVYGDNKKANGIFVFVHPATGEIIKTEEWRIL